MVTINAQFDVITTISNMLQYFVKSSLFYTLRLVCLQYFDPSLYSIPFLISFAYFMWGIILSANCLPHLHPSLKQISDFRLLRCSVRMYMVSSYVTRRIHRIYCNILKMDTVHSYVWLTATLLAYLVELTDSTCVLLRWTILYTV